MKVSVHHALGIEKVFVQMVHILDMPVVQAAGDADIVEYRQVLHASMIHILARNDRCKVVSKRPGTRSARSNSQKTAGIFQESQPQFRISLRSGPSPSTWTQRFDGRRDPRRDPRREQRYARSTRCCRSRLSPNACGRQVHQVSVPTRRPALKVASHCFLPLS